MNCLICGSTTKTEYDKQLKADYYRCNCGFIFKSRIIDGQEEYDHYAKHNNTMENTGYVDMFKKLLSKVEAYIKPDKMLDYGCGPGPVLAELLKNEGCFVKTYDKYFEHDIDFSEYQYSTIFMTEVIEHMDEPLKELTRLRNLLSEDGHLIIQTMFIQEPYDSWWYRRDYSHISFFNVDVFEFIAKKIGFTILYTDNISIIVLKRIEREG